MDEPVPDGWVFDIEADNLYLRSTKIWYIRATSLDGSRTACWHPFRGVEVAATGLQEWIESFPDGCLVVGHNILGYDLWPIWKLLNIVPRVGKEGKDWLGGKHVQFIDTFVLSMFLNPNSPRHSLEALSSGCEDEKMDFRARLIEDGSLPPDAPKGAEFGQWFPLTATYCDEDVAATLGVFNRLWRQAKEMYRSGWTDKPHQSFRQISKDYWLYSAQAYTGVKFDIEKARNLVAHIEVEMDKLKKEVEPHLPPRPLKSAEKAFYTMPAKPFKKNGEASANLTKWLEKHDAKLTEEGFVEAYGLSVPFVAGGILPVQLPLEIDDNAELKDYFLKSGWVPHQDFWNVQKGADGKPVRDEKGKLVLTTPKIQHAGNICPNLLKIDGDIPKKVVRFLSYRNRLGIVTGWLANWRMEYDGRLSAEVSGYAPTSRLKHRVVCNVPKADVKVLLGHEMRELFCVEEGFWYVGTDFSALENRTLSHYTYKYDGGAFADLQINQCPHSFNAFAFFPELHSKFDINDKTNKDNSEFKPWRNKAKTGAYLLAFGGGAPKLASSLGLSKQRGQAAYDNYWEMNKGLGLLKKAVEKYYDTTGQKKYIPALDGRLVSVRGKNVLLSCLGQGLGAICMSYASCLMDTWLGELHLDKLGRPFYLFGGKVVKRISVVH